MAEFVMKELADQYGLSYDIYVESAATSSEEIGNPVYPPVRRLLNRHGIDCSAKRARRLTKADYDKFDYIIGMDRWNQRNMMGLFGKDPAKKVHLLMDFTDHPKDVADPWYTDDFETTWNDVNKGCLGLLQRIIKEEKIQ